MSILDYEIRAGYFYSSGDTWVHRTEDGTVRFGITDYAQKKLKEIEYLNLPDVGETIEQNISLGEVESKKSVSDMLAPVSGIISAINDDATDDPSLLNRDPYGAGWILEIDCQQYLKQIANLMNAESYLAFIAERENN